MKQQKSGYYDKMRCAAEPDLSAAGSVCKLGLKITMHIIQILKLTKL